MLYAPYSKFSSQCGPYGYTHIQGPAIKFAKATRWSFSLHNLFYYLTSGHFYYNLGGVQYPVHQSFP